MWECSSMWKYICIEPNTIKNKGQAEHLLQSRHIHTLNNEITNCTIGFNSHNVVLL